VLFVPLSINYCDARLTSAMASSHITTPRLAAVIPFLDIVDVTASHPNDHALALDAIKHARVVYRHVLFGYDFDDLLRHHAAGQRSDIVQFSSTSPSAVGVLA
jgi:hypothetical protein